RASLVESVPVENDIAVDPVIIRAAGNGTGRVRVLFRAQPELDREVADADVRGRARKSVRRIVDPNLHAIDIPDPVAEKAQRPGVDRQADDQQRGPASDADAA